VLSGKNREAGWKGRCPFIEHGRLCHITDLPSVMGERVRLNDTISAILSTPYNGLAVRTDAPHLDLCCRRPSGSQETI